jgi:protocatechuate 4,5-dioxygenase alpha subunit
MSLLKKANRDEFKVDEAKYLDRYKLTSAHREAILKRQWNRMLELGGNIYFAPARRRWQGASDPRRSPRVPLSSRLAISLMLL